MTDDPPTTDLLVSIQGHHGTLSPRPHERAFLPRSSHARARARVLARPHHARARSLLAAAPVPAPTRIHVFTVLMLSYVSHNIESALQYPSTNSFDSNCVHCERLHDSSDYQRGHQLAPLSGWCCKLNEFENSNPRAVINVVKVPL